MKTISGISYKTIYISSIEYDENSPLSGSVFMYSPDMLTLERIERYNSETGDTFTADADMQGVWRSRGGYE